jgi:hypothetical protein
VTLLSTLLSRALAAIPRSLHGGVIVFGSAPMVFAGLKHDVTVDLDLFVSDATYRGLIAAGFVEGADERGLPRIMVADGVEVVREWPGVQFEEVFGRARAHEESGGFLVAALEDLLPWKVDSVREKDRVEAEVVRQAIAARQAGGK